MTKYRQMIYDKFDGHCAYCGENLSSTWQKDHKEPIYRGDTDEQLKKAGLKRGSDDYENSMPSCRRCNYHKDTFSVDKFREQIFLKIERLRKKESNFRLLESYGIIQEKEWDGLFYFEKATNA